MAIEQNDPCVRAQQLQTAYDSLISGSNAQRVTVRSGDGFKEVWFQQGDLSRLKAELQAAKDACAASQGQPTGRFAIRGGSRRCF